MFDMLLASGHQRSLWPSWGKGVAVTLHVLIVGALWRTPVSPAPVSRLRTKSLPLLLQPVAGRRAASPTLPTIEINSGTLTLPPLELPKDIGSTLRTPIVDAGYSTRQVGGPTLLPDSGVYVPSLVQEAPELLSAPMPEYPLHLRAAGVQGQVIVAAVVDTLGQAETGSVRIVLSDNPGFDPSALATVRAARFRPARVFGRAVRVLVQVPVRFRLR